MLHIISINYRANIKRVCSKKRKRYRANPSTSIDL